MPSQETSGLITCFMVSVIWGTNVGNKPPCVRTGCDHDVMRLLETRIHPLTNAGVFTGMLNHMHKKWNANRLQKPEFRGVNEMLVFLRGLPICVGVLVSSWPKISAWLSVSRITLFTSYYSQPVSRNTQNLRNSFHTFNVWVRLMHKLQY